MKIAKVAEVVIAAQLFEQIKAHSQQDAIPVEEEAITSTVEDMMHSQDPSMAQHMANLKKTTIANFLSQEAQPQHHKTRSSLSP